MKKCPACEQKTIPLKWILFHQILKKNCNFYTCTHCNQNIRTGHLINFNAIYTPLFDPIILIVLIVSLFALYDSIGLIYTVLSLVGYFFVFTILFLIQQYIVPLELSLETRCEEKGLTRVQAFFALIAMVLIIVFTLYELLKPLIL